MALNSIVNDNYPCIYFMRLLRMRFTYSAWRPETVTVCLFTSSFTQKVVSCEEKSVENIQHFLHRLYIFLKNYNYRAYFSLKKAYFVAVDFKNMQIIVSESSCSIFYLLLEQVTGFRAYPSLYYVAQEYSTDSSL